MNTTTKPDPRLVALEQRVLRLLTEGVEAETQLVAARQQIETLMEENNLLGQRVADLEKPIQIDEKTAA